MTQDIIPESTQEPTDSVVEELPDSATSDQTEEFSYPSVPRPPNHESLFYTSVPPEVTKNAPCALGVDEAGRGPVLGPMVYALAYCTLDYHVGGQLKAHGFADSKVLKVAVRDELFKRICSTGDELNAEIGWIVNSLSPRDISAGMLRPSHGYSSVAGVYNLNEQAHDATIAMVKAAINQGINVQELYIDTVGPPSTYQEKLKKLFPGITKIVVAKKADSIYPIVSAASVVAKVTRDKCLESHGSGWGSGYPSDPKTSAWLKQSVDKVFGWDQIVRFSWQTTRDVLEKNKGVEFDWGDDNEAKAKYGVSQYFLPSVEEKEGCARAMPFDNWYGANVTSLK